MLNPYFDHGGITIYCGKCEKIMPQLDAERFDTVLTDPPYHLTAVSRNGSPRQNDPATPHGRTRLGSAGFMGKTWDGGNIAFRPELAVLATSSNHQAAGRRTCCSTNPPRSCWTNKVSSRILGMGGKLDTSTHRVLATSTLATIESGRLSDMETRASPRDSSIRPRRRHPNAAASTIIRP